MNGCDLGNNNTAYRRSWILDSGLWTLYSGLWSWTLDVKTLKFKIAQRFGNNGAISMTSFLNFTLVKIFSHFRYENLSTVYSFQAILCNHPINIKNQRFSDDVEREGRLVVNWYDLLFLIKHKQWDFLWQLIFFIFSKHVVEQKKNQ